MDSKKILFRVLTVAVGCLCGNAVLQADVVNVDFQAGGAGGTYSASYTGQGAYADPGNDTWNIVAPDAPAGGDPESGGFFSTAVNQALVDSTGAASGMTLRTADGVAIAWNSANGTYADFADDAKDLMSDYLQMDSSGFARSVFIEGLTVGQEYELYLYGSGPFGRDTEFTVRTDTDALGDFGGSEVFVGTTATNGASGSHNLTLGDDYVTFSFTTGAGQDTLWVEYKGVDADPFASFNGLQLAAVPEPSSLLLMGLAGISMLVFRRSRNK